VESIGEGLAQCRIIVCSRPAHYDQVTQALEAAHALITHADDIDALLTLLGGTPADVVVIMSDSLEDVTRFVAASDIPLVFVSEHPDPYEAVRVLREGAVNYAEPGEPLMTAVQEVLNARHPERVRPRWLDSERSILGRIISRTKIMGEVVQRIRDVAKTPNTTVLVLGETGVGKELVANAIHALSSRAEAPFVAIDCSTIPETLMEGELFGHERGSFSGAVSDRKGRVELADGGTLFLDEVGELPLPMQAKLLRMLEQREVWRVGATKARPVNVRVVAATHRDLSRMVTAGTFRADLYYRLAVFEIRVPSLRERTADILHLAEFFLDRFCREHSRLSMKFTPEAAAKLVAYDYPGNVRELRNIVEQALVTSSGDTILGSELRFRSGPSLALSAAPAPPNAEGEYLHIEWGENALDQLERRAIERALLIAEGNQTRAAKLLGVQRLSLVRAMARHGLQSQLPRGRPKKSGESSPH
jgi:DNA-binding NtrC family response regulator